MSSLDECFVPYFLFPFWSSDLCGMKLSRGSPPHLGSGTWLQEQREFVDSVVCGGSHQANVRGLQTGGLSGVLVACVASGSAGSLCLDWQLGYSNKEGNMD